jgi:DNA-binding transcriptional LysR family regulator
MTIRDAECILSIAKHKSVSKAADEIFVTHQALSKTLKQVENELGERLFSRSSSGVEITDMGIKLMPVIGSLVSDYQKHINIITKVIKNNKQQIRISCEHCFLPALIPAGIMTTFAEFEIKTNIVHTSKKCLEDLRAGKSELALCHKLDDFLGELGELKYEPVLNDYSYIIMHQDNPLSAKKELELFDLKNVPILNGFMKGSASQVIMNACISEGFFPNMALQSDDLKILLDNVRSNTGVLLFSPYFLPAKSNDIVCIPLKHRVLQIHIGFFTLPKASETIHSFIKAVQDYYSKKK